MRDSSFRKFDGCPSALARQGQVWIDDRQFAGMAHPDNVLVMWIMSEGSCSDIEVGIVTSIESPIELELDRLEAGFGHQCIGLLLGHRRQICRHGDVSMGANALLLELRLKPSSR